MDASKIMCDQCKLWEENGDDVQRICEVCTAERQSNFPSDDVEEAVVVYPNDDEVGDKDNIFKNTVSWRDVERDIWLRVTETCNVKTMHGPSTIVLLQKRDGILTKAWTTNIISRAILAKESTKGDKKNLFIKSLGKSKCKSSNNSYFNFQLKLF